MRLAWWYIVPLAISMRRLLHQTVLNGWWPLLLQKKLSANNLNTPENKDAAAVGKIVAERALEKGIKAVSFDRSGFQYHGRVRHWQMLPVKLAFSSKVEV